MGGDRRAKPRPHAQGMAPLVVVPRLSIAKQLRRYCAGRAFGAGIGLMVGQLV